MCEDNWLDWVSALGFLVCLAAHQVEALKVDIASWIIGTAIATLALGCLLILAVFGRMRDDD